MRHIFILFAFWAAGLSAMAQPCKYEITPAVIDAFTSPVTIIFDATGTPMAGETEAYLWSWAEGGAGNMDICGPDWGAIYPSAKLTPVEGQPNKFQLVLPYTTEVKGTTITFNNFADLFSTSIAPGKLLRVGFMLRSLDGSKQTNGDFACDLRLSPLTFSDNEFRTFPSTVSVKDVVTAYLNPALSASLQVKIMQDVAVKLSFIDATGAILYEMPEYVATVKSEQGAWKYSFLPEKLVTLPAGKQISDIEKFKAEFKGFLKKTDGTREEVEATFEQDFKDYK